MSIEAFVIPGKLDEENFLLNFLRSFEFRQHTLKNLAPKKSLAKGNLATSINDAVKQGTITTDKIIAEFAKQERHWLSIKLGEIKNQPKFNDPANLVSGFGQVGWYGPVLEEGSDKVWYIRTFKQKHETYIGSGEARTVDSRDIRWTVIAEIAPSSIKGQHYVALSWNGFSNSQIDQELGETKKQFPYWLYIPQFFDELEQHLCTSLQEPNLYKLLLTDVWEKYINNPRYRWQHLKIRAEASGVALNASSAGISEIDIRGLQALTRELAKSAVSELPDLIQKQADLHSVETALLRTLIKEWGTKSYEFSLSKLPLLDVENNAANGKSKDSQIAEKKKTETIFRSHCYFGAKPESQNPDALQHLYSYFKDGGSTNALRFIMQELSSQQD